MWVHPKAQFYIFAIRHFDWPFTKKSLYFDIPQTLSFSTNMGLWWFYSKKYFESTFCLASLLYYNFYQ
jgi:hypothetical protein